MPQPPEATATRTVSDAIAEILLAEGVEFLSAYPTTPLIDAAARVGIRPVLCRQERVGVGIADGFTRVAGQGRFGVFACQYGPGAENAFSGIASAHADGIPILVLPMANALSRSQMAPLFDSARAFKPITKSFETLLRPRDVVDVMRRAISAVKNGPPGPVMVEIPLDVAAAPAPAAPLAYEPVQAVRSAADGIAVERAVKALLSARAPVILAGHGVLQAGASAELVELAEELRVPVITTLAGKSAISEHHPLALGTASMTASDPVVDHLQNADLVLAVGSSLTRHFLSPRLPKDARLIQVTVAARDFNKSRPVEHPLLGDARLVLRQILEAVRARGTRQGPALEELGARIAAERETWLKGWLPKLTSGDSPITPYRVIHEFCDFADPDATIVTHDSGSPRDQITPFYRAGGPATYLGWGKSHALGAGLGLTIGAKLAAPDKLAVHFQGDAAFGMTGLDIETAARCGIPILSVVLNNSTMAIETDTLVESHDDYGTRDIGGNYAALAQSLGVEARRVEAADELADAFEWGRRTTEAGAPALIEVMTCAETEFANRLAVTHH
jgi:acetolactate synthase-1/2/3 large subunit